MPQTQGNIPSAAQSTAASSVDIISDLLKEAHAADTQAAQAVKAANQPIAGGHQLPGSANLPGNPNHQFYDYDTHPVVGHHNATMRGIVNLSKGVSNLIGSVDAAVAQKKTQRLAVNIERLMGAVNSTDQAKQALQNDPNNPAAQEQLKKAQAIQDEILSDPKVRKDIAKAYNINFTDPSKNNTPEHAALKQATDSYSQQFQKQLPTNLQQDPAKVAAAQTATIQAKATHDLVDKIAPALIRQQTDIEKAQITAQGKLDAEAAKEKFTWSNDRQKAEESLNKVLVGANEHLRLAAFNQDREDRRFFAGLDEKLKASGAKNGGIKDMKTSDLQHALSEADSIEAKDPQALSNFISVRDEVQKGQGKKFNADDLKQANEAIYYFKQNQSAHQKARTEIQNELNRRLGVSSGSAGQQSGATTTSTTAAAKPVVNLSDVDPDTDTDDE
jgi:hypothetical protein